MNTAKMIMSVNWSKVPDKTSRHDHIQVYKSELPGALCLFTLAAGLKNNPSLAMAKKGRLVDNMVALVHPSVVSMMMSEMNNAPPFPQKLLTASTAAIWLPLCLIASS